jgi:hypothetical protein
LECVICKCIGKYKTDLSNWINTFRFEYSEFIASSVGVINDTNAISWEFMKISLMIELTLEKDLKCKNSCMMGLAYL